ncbi:MAG: hypothetical protein JWM02_1943, partial [Frankiales bacterium]|nr:hypothetical protein [Frankiales bacterium]
MTLTVGQLSTEGQTLLAHGGQRLTVPVR